MVTMNQRARQERISAAIDRLAGLYEGGHLLAATTPEVLLGMACDEIEQARSDAVDDPDARD